ncbi:MAG TPA: hypothetical protein VKE74_27060, partial [Gemmataceae bacterium]|nr:hypothetical protein [Gemmataceae bacterium]
MASPRALTSWLAPLTNSRRRRRRPAPGSRLGLESLECRVVPATLLPPPDPIDPTKGQTNLLRVVQMMADKQNLNAQDHFPVPYTIIVSAGGAAPTIKNWHAGTAIQLDADQNKATGQGGGGNDIQVEVNTDFYTNALGQPDWKLRLNVNRLGKDSFAQNLSVMIAFPFDAFNTETLPAKPNLLMGFQTRLPGTPGQADYTTGADGGNAPATMQMVLTPHILAGTTHAFEWSIDTTGATNPLTFLSGEFDGNPGSNTILNALGWSAYVQDVPAHIGAELKVAENAIGSPAVDSKMDLHWTASAPSLTTFDYLEAESKAAASSPQTADYATQIVADKMPTDEHFVLRQDEAGGVMTLNHDANAPIHEMTFLKRRSDGLALTGVASDENPAADAVPTHVALTLGLRGYETLDVNDNTLDLFLQDTQVGGFNNTSQFFQKYNLEYVALKVKNAPDQSANFDGAGTTFTMLVTNAGEVAPFTEMVLDDNGRISATNAPQNLELPDKYDVTPLWDLWSIVDDGTHGTAVARALDVTRLPASPKFTGSATFDHEPTEIVETVELQTVAAHPMQTYLKSGLLSAVQPPIPASAISPDPYVEITGHIEDVPTDHTRVTLDFPLDADWDTDHKIGEICMAGHIGSLNFATILEDNPTHGSFKFRPEGSLVVTALDQSNNPDFFSGNAAIVYDVNGFDPNVVHWPEDYSLNGFHSKHETFFPNDTRLKEARLRLDHVPSMRATWDDEPQHTYIDIDTDATSGPFAYVGGIQLQISTKTTLGGTVLTCDNVKDFLPPAATPQSQHYALLKDVAGEQTLKFGVFGVDSFHFASDDTSKPSKYSVDWALDPARPATASRIDVDAHPTSTGALGTFFGGSEVTGPLLISAVPADMHVKSDFDPSFSTATLFPFGLPVPLEINQPMTVDGTDIFVHAVQVPQIFSVTWNTAGPTTNLSVVATDKFGNPAAAKVVDVIFRNPNGLPDGSDLFQDAANPLRRFDVQVDNVPSLKASLTTTGNPHVNIDTTATAGPFQYLGGLRMAASTNAGPPLPAPPIIPPIPPTYPAPTPADHPYLRLRDVGANKSIEVGAFGLDNIDVLVNNAASTATITYNADAARPFTAMVHSVNGRFFSTHTVDAGLVVNALPQSETLTIAANGQSLTSTAGAQGQISSIQLGGTDLVDPTFNPSTQPSATYDNVLIDVAAQNLPNIFGYSFNPAGSVSLTADNTPAALPDRIGGVTAYIRSQSGIPGTAGILGSPLKDARLRLDDVPSLSGTWSTGGGNTSFALDTTGTNVFLGGAQVGLSTLFGDVAPLSAPTPGQGQTFTALDRTLPGLGPVARLSAGLFGLEHVSLTYTKSPAQLTTHYQADVARRLDVSFNTRAGCA